MSYCHYTAQGKLVCEETFANDEGDIVENFRRRRRGPTYARDDSVNTLIPPIPAKTPNVQVNYMDESLSYCHSKCYYTPGCIGYASLGRYRCAYITDNQNPPSWSQAKTLLGKTEGGKASIFYREDSDYKNVPTSKLVVPSYQYERLNWSDYTTIRDPTAQTPQVSIKQSQSSTCKQDCDTTEGCIGFATSSSRKYAPCRTIIDNTKTNTWSQARTLLGKTKSGWLDIYYRKDSDFASPKTSSVVAPKPKPVVAPVQPVVAPKPKPVVPPGQGCYGANDGICKTCDDVVNAYKARGWAYDRKNFEQCKTVSQPAPVQPVVVAPKPQPVVAPVQSASTSCYGARNGECRTCDDVINAYKAKGWAYDRRNFEQCKVVSQPAPVQPVVAPKPQPVVAIAPQPQQVVAPKPQQVAAVRPDAIVSNSCIKDTCKISNNKQYQMCQQSDGHLVLYKVPTGKVLWATGIAPGPGGNVCMQDDGNLVNYMNGKPYWSTNTRTDKPVGPYTAVMQDDGNFVIYQADGKPTWSTNTHGL